jgi:hypothetical protein
LEGTILFAASALQMTIKLEVQREKTSSFWGPVMNVVKMTSIGTSEPLIISFLGKNILEKKQMNGFFYDLMIYKYKSVSKLWY